MIGQNYLSLYQILFIYKNLKDSTIIKNIYNFTNIRLILYIQVVLNPLNNFT